MADLSQTPANVALSTTTRVGSGIAAGTVTAGMPIYKTSTGTIAGCDCSALGTASCNGIVLNGASAGQPVDYAEWGDIDLGAALTVGAIYCVSATYGKIALYADLGATEYLTILGIAGVYASNSQLGRGGRVIVQIHSGRTVHITCGVRIVEKIPLISGNKSGLGGHF